MHRSPSSRRLVGVAGQLCVAIGLVDVAGQLGSGCGCLIVVLVSVTNQFTILELVGVVLICVAAQFPGPAHLLFTACSAKLPGVLLKKGNGKNLIKLFQAPFYSMGWKTGQSLETKPA